MKAIKGRMQTSMDASFWYKAGRRKGTWACVAMACLFFLMGNLLEARAVELCFAPTDTGLTIGSFTLSLYSWDSAGAAAVSTTGVAVAHDSDEPAGCYIFTGLPSDDLLNYHFVATVTANGHDDDVRFPIGGAAQGVQWINELVVPSSTAAFYKNATRPAYTVTIKPSLSQTCSGATVAFSMKKQGSTTARVLTGTATETNETSGTVGGVTYYGCDLVFSWGAGDLDMDDCTESTCRYSVQFTVTYSDGGIHPMPPSSITVSSF